MALVVGVRLPHMQRSESEESLDELGALARASDARVAGRALQNRTRIDGRTYIGAGKARELREEADAVGANLIILDHDLSPAQARNLEKLIDLKVVDRTELILDIFARRARTPQAKLQVEAAQLEYLLPRLTRLWEHLSRMGGGIGTRGPGETQLEVDRRRIRTRLTRLRRRLDTIGRQRENRRRLRTDVFRVALVGYTNTGKSSLLNRLTSAEVSEGDRLFETLDATTRIVPLGRGYRATLTDTVGFVRRLPHGLVESFRATLAEVVAADLLLHVVDASSPEAEARRLAVEAVLREIGAHEVPQIVVHNKCDLLEPAVLDGLRRARDRGARDRRAGPAPVLASALRGEGLEDLIEAIRRQLREKWVAVRGILPAREGKILARLRAVGEIREEEATAEGIRLDLRIARGEWGRLRAQHGERLPDFFGTPDAADGAAGAAGEAP